MQTRWLAHSNASQIEDNGWLPKLDARYDFDYWMLEPPFKRWYDSSRFKVR